MKWVSQQREADFPYRERRATLAAALDIVKFKTPT